MRNERELEMELIAIQIHEGSRENMKKETASQQNTLKELPTK